jgi:hypothetical protein
MTADNKAPEHEGGLTLEPIDYFQLFDDLVRWMRPDLTLVDARDRVHRFLTAQVRPGFNPVRERVLIDNMHEERTSSVKVDEGRDLIAKIMKQQYADVFGAAPPQRDPKAVERERDIRRDRHEWLRDEIEKVVRAAIKKIDQYVLNHGHEHLTYDEVTWVLAHVIHDLLRFGPIHEDPTDWADVEEFIRKLRMMDYRKHDARWHKYDPCLDSHCIPWFYCNE